MRLRVPIAVLNNERFFQVFWERWTILGRCFVLNLRPIYSALRQLQDLCRKLRQISQISYAEHLATLPRNTVPPNLGLLGQIRAESEVALNFKKTHGDLAQNPCAGKRVPNCFSPGD